MLAEDANNNHPTQSCEYLMQHKTKMVKGSPFSQRGSPFNQGKWGPGVPIFMGSPKFYDTGTFDCYSSFVAVFRNVNVDVIRHHRFTEEYRDIRMRKQCIPGLPPAIEGLGTRLTRSKNPMDASFLLQR